MAKDDNHPIRNKIIASVVAGLILSILGYLIYAVPDTFRWIGKVFTSVWNHLASTVSVPYWLLWLLGILSATTVSKVIRNFFKRDRTAEPTFKMYTRDSFEGVTWRWSYEYDHPTSILAYCPSCDSELVPNKELYRLGPASSVSFFCENCKRQRCEIQGGNEAYAISMIQRLIERRVRNGEWKRLIERDGS